MTVQHLNNTFIQVTTVDNKKLVGRDIYTKISIYAKIYDKYYSDLFINNKLYFIVHKAY